MLKYFRTDNQILYEEERIGDGVWVQLTSPAQEECEKIQRLRKGEVSAMLKYFRTDNQILYEEERIGDGVWVQLTSPAQEECEKIAQALNVDIEDIKAALDPEESSRIELQDGYTLILLDIPTTEIRHEKQSYTTIPLGIILAQDVIVTICTEDTPVLSYSRRMLSLQSARRIRRCLRTL